MMKDQMIFQRILNEVERIRWEVEWVEKNVLMAKTFAEEVFKNGREVLKGPWDKKSLYASKNRRFYEKHQAENRSCVSTGNIHKISPEDKKFIFTKIALFIIISMLSSLANYLHRYCC